MWKWRTIMQQIQVIMKGNMRLGSFFAIPRIINIETMMKIFDRMSSWGEKRSKRNGKFEQLIIILSTSFD
jgi:hypothetical protein